MANVTSRAITIDALLIRTAYSFEVAAVNGDGTGVYSSAVTHTTAVPTGTGFYLNGQLYPNNSVVGITDIGVGDNSLQCITDREACCGSTSDGGASGDWFLPRQDTGSGGDAAWSGDFSVERRSSAVLLSRRNAVTEPTGLYHCEVLDSRGVLQSVYIGVYRDTGGIPSLATDALTYSAVTHSLTCVSTGGPVTSVAWGKDNTSIATTSSSHTQRQIVVNTITATYHNLLSIISVDIRDYSSTYTCNVSNARGSATESIQINSIYITGNRVFELGETSGITCSIPVPVQSVQWLEESYDVVRQGTSARVLVLDFVVAASHNNTEYTCGVSDGEFVETQTVTITTGAIPTIDVNVFVEGSGAIAGRSLTLVCEVSGAEMLRADTTFVWTKGSDDGSRVLERSEEYTFLPTGADDGDVYQCGVTVTSLLLLGPLNTSGSISISVLAAPVLAVDTVTSTTITLTWTQSGSAVDRYTAYYTYTIRGCSLDPTSGRLLQIDGNASSFSLTDLEEDSNYAITLTAISGNKLVDSNTITTTTNVAAPSGIPSFMNFTDISLSSVTVLWGELPCSSRNGEITGYTVEYSSFTSPPHTGTIAARNTVLVVSGLLFNTMYNFSVRADGAAYTATRTISTDTPTERCREGDFQIDGGPTDLVGNVEVCVNRTWGTVCAEGWDDIAASILCQQIGHSPNGATAGSGAFTEPGHPSYMSDLSCNGSEVSLFQCSHSINKFFCPPDTVAEVVCQDSTTEASNCTHGDVRLSGPAARPSSGRVEVCIHEVWGTVCDDGWDVLDAGVVCGQLGYLLDGAVPQYGAFYGESSKPVLLTALSCSGTEQSLLSCSGSTFGVTECGNYEEAGVICRDSVPVTLSQRVGTLLGGNVVTVTGMSVDEDDVITCTFGETTVDGVYVSEEQVVCVTPPAKEEAVVEFRVQLQRRSQSLVGGAQYQYISPESVTDSVTLQTNERIIWSIGEVANISWIPASLVLSDLMSTGTVKVDISMWVYGKVSRAFEETAMLATNLPNSGSASLTLPDSLNSSLPHLHIMFVRVGVNVSTTDLTQFHGSSGVSNILREVGQFGKTRLVSQARTSSQRRLLCEAWASEAQQFPSGSIPPCPCNEDTARGDDRFQKEEYSNSYKNATASLLRRYVLYHDSRHCYRQATVRDFGPGQQCCYGEDGSIITGTNGAAADLVAPTSWETIPMHFTVDVSPWYLCCTGLFKDCGKYASLRPVDNCSGWPHRSPPAQMFGDPHLVTLDGYQYTFNGRGEFTLVETLDESFILQGRMIQPLGSTKSTSAGGTSFLALAMKQRGSPTIQLEILGDELVVLVDGQQLDFAGLSEQRVGNVTVFDEGDDRFTVRITSGVTLQASKRNQILTNIRVTVPEDFVTRGLLGQFNGDPTDDLLPWNSALPLPTDSATEEIHYHFGTTWIVDDPSNSLFTYGPNGGWDTFFDEKYVPIFEPTFSSPELQEQAIEVCGDNQLCMFDIAATGDVDIGSSTLDSVRQEERLRELFVPSSCDPPCVNGACASDDICSCSNGFEGELCELEVFDECESNVCENGAGCKQLAGDYICDCTPNFTGAFCENEGDNNEESSVAAIVGGVIGGVLALLILTLCITVAFCCVKKRESKDLVEHEQSSKMELDTIPKRRANTYEGISYKKMWKN